MKQFFSISLLGFACWGLAAAQNEFATLRGMAHFGFATSSGQPSITPDKTELRVETTGNVSLQGAASEQTSYKLTVRVRAGDRARSRSTAGTI